MLRSIVTKLTFLLSLAALSLVSAEAAFPTCQEALTLPRQSSNEIAELYTQAKTVLPILESFLKHVAAKTAASAEGIGLKLNDRFEKKTGLRKGGDPSFVLDIARGALIAENIEGVFKLVRELEQSANAYGIRVVRLKERFTTPKESGYRDVQVNLAIELPGSTDVHIVEVQVHLRSLYELKKIHGDELYREIRSLEESGQSPERLQELKKEHRKLFEETYQKNVFNLQPQNAWDHNRKIA